jgi:outer membrane immunogenic protein
MKYRVLLVSMFFVVVSTTASRADAGPYLGASGGISILHDSDSKGAGATPSNQVVTGPFRNQGGVVPSTTSYDASGTFNVFGGYAFGNGLRIEGEFGYKNADVSKFEVTVLRSVGVQDSDITVKSYMVNSYFDFKNKSVVTPFLGVGLGLLDGEFRTGTVTNSANAIGYQLTAGVGFKAAEHIFIDLSYRFQGAADDFTVNGVDTTYGSSNILAGLRYQF